MTLIATSVAGTTIRLTDERWAHIAAEHAELADLQADILATLSQPERVVAGAEGELLAYRQIEASKWLIVVYREQQDDGFVITAFMTRRIAALLKRAEIWP